MDKVHHEVSDELLSKRLAYCGLLMLVVACTIATIANYIG